ncbi:MAG: methylmalonyl-CoA mutase family protein [Planctomycetaceae bacterium]|nr:methylmalonyl-CoA mutase family protein [Planctomycetaceae bacterium]
MTKIDDEYQRWRKQSLEPFTQEAPERKTPFQTSSGIEQPPLALPEGLTSEQTKAYLDSLGFPGEFPFTRGVYPNMYRGRFWTMRQYAGFGDAEESNKRYKFLLSQGVMGLSVAFDLPTQIGYDSDHAMAEGEVGKVGVAISTLDDMLRLFDGIPMDQVSTSMTINASASVLLALYIAVADQQGVSRSKIKGTIQNDILKEYVARGTYIYPPGPSLRIITDIFAFCNKEVPQWNTISISGYHIREAGSTAVQEVAFTLAHGICYVEAALKAGLNVDSFGRRLSFFFNAHNNFLEEVAKFRAARRMWARIMKERFGAKDPRAMMLRFHTQTAGSTLTAQQPENNIVRTSLQALSAVLGGTQSLHTNSFDEALALPTERSAQIALRTQQIIANESGVTDTPDPLAGSYAVEYLTDEIERRALEYIKRIDDLGGAVAAVDAHFMQDEIARAALDYQKDVEAKRAIVVGVNQFTTKEAPYQDLQTIDASAQRRQMERVKAFRSKRDKAAADKALADLRSGAQGTANVMPLIIGAVKARATLGEICDVMRSVFGEYRS